MCGEKRNSRSSRQCNRGSPPHVRGKGCLPALALGHVGITPACAGKSHLCDRMPSVTKGSPPHVRGKGSSLGWSRAFHGITPACAGKSLPSLFFAHTYWDHPRMCGEKHYSLKITFLSSGSPPHVRGKDAHAAMRARVLRITPAHAGKRPC